MVVKDEVILLIVAIICMTILEIVNMLTMKLDGNVMSAIIGAIVFVATRAYYKKKSK
jgi:hypothetical protein